MNPMADFWKDTTVVGWRPELAENFPQKTLFEVALSLAEPEQHNLVKSEYKTVFTDFLAMTDERATRVNPQNFWRKNFGKSS